MPGPIDAIVEVHEHRAVLVPEQVAEVAVAVDAQLARGPGGLEHALHALQQRAARALVGLTQLPPAAGR